MTPRLRNPKAVSPEADASGCLRSTDSGKTQPQRQTIIQVESQNQHERKENSETMALHTVLEFPKTKFKVSKEEAFQIRRSKVDIGFAAETTWVLEHSR